MLYPLVLHEHPRAFGELLLEPFERPRFTLERDEGPASFVALP
jgi:hypothetical protein